MRVMQHAIGPGMVMLAAILINLYFSFSGMYWISLAAFFVCQVTGGAPLRQAVIFFLIISGTMLMVSGLEVVIANETMILLVLATVYVLGAYVLFIAYFLSYNKIIFIFLFLFIWVITGLSPSVKPISLEHQFLDIGIGVMMGIAGKIFIFPLKAEAKFRRDMVPLLNTLVDSMSLLCDFFLDPEKEGLNGRYHTGKIQKILQAQQGKYLEWIHDGGFNPKLRPGFRFFLIRLEWIIESMLSMNYLLSRPLEVNLLQELSDDCHQVMQNNLALMVCLLRYFEKGVLQDISVDFKSDLIDLKVVLQRNVPVSVELLDLSTDYINLTAIVSEIKDLRGLLLQLVAALPA